MTFYEIRICKDSQWRKTLFIDCRDPGDICEWWEDTRIRATKYVQSLCPGVEIIDKPIEIDPRTIDTNLYADHPNIIKLIHQGVEEKDWEDERIENSLRAIMNLEYAIPFYNY